jgi:hypothetical protein
MLKLRGVGDALHELDRYAEPNWIHQAATAAMKMVGP